MHPPRSQIYLRSPTERDFSDLFRPHVTLVFDVVTLKNDRFMWMKLVNLHQPWFVRLQNIAFTSLVTHELTNGQTDKLTEV